MSCYFPGRQQVMHLWQYDKSTLKDDFNIHVQAWKRHITNLNWIAEFFLCFVMFIVTKPNEWKLNRPCHRSTRLYVYTVKYLWSLDGPSQKWVSLDCQVITLFYFKRASKSKFLFKLYTEWPRSHFTLRGSGSNISAVTHVADTT